MDEAIYNYRKLLQLIDTELDTIEKSIEGELLEQYRRILMKERDEIEKYFRAIHQTV